MIKPKEVLNWSLIEQRNNYNLVYSEKLKVFAEQYQVPDLSLQQIEQWGQRIHLKQENIVQILHHHFVEEEGLSARKKGRTLVVYTELVSCRLSELLESEFDYEEQWLLQCLRGFQRLFQQYGGFKVRPSMVAITPKHKARVWLNPNFLKNSKLDGEQKQPAMVEATIKLFKKVNVIIPGEDITFREMIEFMERQVMTKGELKKVRSKSDILYIDKLEFNGPGSNSSGYNSKSTLTNQQKAKIKNMLQVEQGMKGNPKPKKDSMTTQNSSINEREGTISTLLSDTMSFQKKVKMLDEILKESQDGELKRFCYVYKHGLVYNDRFLLKQIHAAKGKLSAITNPPFFAQITQILSHHQEQLPKPRPHISSMRVHEILNKERAKRHIESSSDTKEKLSFHELKSEVSKLLLD